MDGYTYITCANCGVKFAIRDEFYRVRGRSGDTVWCPSGHRLTVGGPSDADKIKRLSRRLQLSQANVDERDAEISYVNKRLAATKGVVTKMKNKA